MESIYGRDDAITIINNSDSYVYLGGNDLRTGQMVSQKLNAPLEDVLYMPVGREIIFRRGSKPIVTDRYDICSDARYRKITEDYQRRLDKEIEK
ncbi:MAG: TraM recognition domain-containing protein [Bilifractor sp.]